MRTDLERWETRVVTLLVVLFTVASTAGARNVEESAPLWEDFESKPRHSRQRLSRGCAELDGSDANLIWFLVGYAVFSLLFLTWWARARRQR